jgi:hypothetical protein
MILCGMYFFQDFVGCVLSFRVNVALSFVPITPVVLLREFTILGLVNVVVQVFSSRQGNGLQSSSI